MRTGIAHLPLHGGKAPRWLFDRMKKLARYISIAIVEEYGSEEFLRRLADPFWFQAFGCTLGFDWHSSGLTTTVGGALKEGLRDLDSELGFFAAGGKGGTSRKTPSEIEDVFQRFSGNPEPLIYASRMAAKVDSAALQDGFQLYHHNFFFTGSGKWCVVQQGMNDTTHYARRYHWLSDDVRNFVCEPHKAICSDSKGQVLNMVAQESEGARNKTAELARQKPHQFIREITEMNCLNLPDRHAVHIREDINPKHLHTILLKTYEKQPEGFEALLGTEGVGPKTIRSLCLVSELIYGIKPSFRDPVRYSFAYGGKDGHPYRIDRGHYDQSIEILSKALDRSDVDRSEKIAAFKRLTKYFEN